MYKLKYLESFSEKWFYLVPTDEYHKMTSSSSIFCFNRKEIEELSDLFNNSISKFTEGILSSSFNDFFISDHFDLSEHIKSNTAELHTTDGKVQKLIANPEEKEIQWSCENYTLCVYDGFDGEIYINKYDAIF